MHLDDRKRRLALVAAAIGIAAAPLAVAGTPAAATVVATDSTGWHGGAGTALGSCGAWRNLATGSDGLWMQARVCIRTVGVGDQVQPTVELKNNSRSSATATANSQGYGEGSATTWAPLYTCGSYTLPAYGSVYCRGRISRFPSSATRGGTTGNAWVNGYGGSLTRPSTVAVVNRAAVDKILSVAAAEYSNTAHNHEIGGYNCNYYSTALAAGATGSCSNGWRTEEWCADFARWVWGQAGVRTSGLTAGAGTFGSSSSTTFRWGSSAANAAVGDAVLFGYDGASYASHVGLVTAVNSDGTITITEGNAGPNTNSVYRRTVNPASAGVSGYASPKL